MSPADRAARDSYCRALGHDAFALDRGSVRLGCTGKLMSSANDTKAAEATYHSFIGLIKVAVPIIAVIAAFVIYLIH